MASAGAFSLPTSTSSARGVVQFWLTRRLTPAAIYGHRLLVVCQALRFRLLSHLLVPRSAAVRFQSHYSLSVRAQQRRSGSAFTTFPYPKIPDFDLLYDLNDYSTSNTKHISSLQFQDVQPPPRHRPPSAISPQIAQIPQTSGLIVSQQPGYGRPSRWHQMGMPVMS